VEGFEVLLSFGFDHGSREIKFPVYNTFSPFLLSPSICVSFCYSQHSPVSLTPQASFPTTLPKGCGSFFFFFFFFSLPNPERLPSHGFSVNLNTSRNPTESSVLLLPISFPAVCHVVFWGLYSCPPSRRFVLFFFFFIFLDFNFGHSFFYVTRVPKSPVARAREELD